jgi:hypothetical protein
MYLAISTLPHLYSILPIIKYYRTHTFGYTNIILLSSISSILYHIYEETNYTITIIDYTCAILWFLYDMYMGYTYTDRSTIGKILLGNFIVFIINIQVPYNNNYIINHSLWHILSSFKCYYVSYIIHIHLNNPDKKNAIILDSCSF